MSEQDEARMYLASLGMMNVEQPAVDAVIAVGSDGFRGFRMGIARERERSKALADALLGLCPDHVEPITWDGVWKTWVHPVQSIISTKTRCFLNPNACEALREWDLGSR